MTGADLVIIGNGMACHKLLADLIQQPNRPARILVFGAETKAAYNRVLLSSLLAGELSDEAAELCPTDWYQQHQIELVLGDAVVHLDKDKKQLISRSGLVVRYQQLVLALGAEATTPPYAKTALPGLCTFRNWSDLEQLRQVAAKGGKAIVLGGGFLGLEAAEGLRKQGMQVSLLQRSGYLLNRQLDPAAATLLQQQLEHRGLTIYTHASVSTLLQRDQKFSAVVLTDGRQLEADVLVMALGITPNIQLAQQAGLRTEQGICVDAQLRSSEPDIFALGECCQFGEHTFGLVAPIAAQAQVLAAFLSGQNASYQLSDSSTQLKISGIQLSSCGDIPALLQQQDVQQFCYQDQQHHDYRRLWLDKKRRLVGAVCLGDTSLSGFYAGLINQQKPVSCSTELLFGPAQQAA
ncbi:MAG: FAD-dependent oxidoreductase [Gammaproteobacteria bacterium]|nr:FAD-dependent oxidoreductase [Gammaproteobacteria bacterium]MBU2056471.1 FAD-dependent oxidoreductase [Gammaproteobacteria bacterium]MBU2173816.1 FAD-dependent oxidoreductase [Gammaproteobacteria bacterium]MBU2248879.1 FAD-dependent oxidoreductase [Gammaproteobacteria bacterium]MBU2344001.1 FAD-dependent oxidoreductase [Gammaproteobacteria bacterium]